MVCPTADRPQFIKRAHRCFFVQSYPNKRLLFLDSGIERAKVLQVGSVYCEYMPDLRGQSIGNLRNVANGYAKALNADIIAHLDVDDWSHPRRLEEQVELLERSGKECVGYNEMLFWDATQGQFCGAWLYRLPLPGYALGTSLMYRRKVWERNPFEDTSNGEDTAFLRKVSCSSASAKYGETHAGDVKLQCEPRMIATIHAGNTSRSMVIDPAHSEWKRVPEWDARVRSIMEGA